MGLAVPVRETCAMPVKPAAVAQDMDRAARVEHLDGDELLP